MVGKASVFRDSGSLPSANLAIIILCCAGIRKGSSAAATYMGRKTCRRLLRRRKTGSRAGYVRVHAHGQPGRVDAALGARAAFGACLDEWRWRWRQLFPPSWYQLIYSRKVAIADIKPATPTPQHIYLPLSLSLALCLARWQSIERRRYDRG